MPLPHVTSKEAVVDPNDFKVKANLKQLQLSGLSFWLTVLLVVSLLTTVGLGWVVQWVFILLASIPVLAIVAVLGLQWWIRRKLVQDRCPVCQFEFVGIKDATLNCPSCGETLQVVDDRFERSTPAGTIDVQATDVSVKTLDSSVIPNQSNPSSEANDSD